MKVATLQAVIHAKQQGQAVVLVTDLNDHSQQYCVSGALEPDHPLQPTVAQALRSDRSQIVEIDARRHFIQVINQPLRLLIVGAVHIAQALIPMAQACGYAVTLIDPRRAFASQERFTGVELSNQWPDKALAMLGLDSRTAVVTLTHDPKLDEPALIEALNSNVFYVGALGSRRTHEARCQRLAAANVSSDMLNKINAPIGLNIGAKSPAEIAISIMAEVTAALRNEGTQ